MLLSALLCLAVSAGDAPAGPQRGFDHFITRRADRLLDGEKPFRFIGANMPGLVLPYDYTLGIEERMRLPTAWEQEDAFKTLRQMNFAVVRTWNLPVRKPDEPARPWHYVLGPGEFNNEAFKTIDRMLALANLYRVRVILDLTAGSGDYLGGVRTYAAHRGKTRPEFYTDPELKADYKATVRHVLQRVNTITGVPYKDDRAILAWQFGNEMRDATTEWLAEMAAYIKSLAPNHLVAETRHRPGDPLELDPNIDLYTRHLYSNYPSVGSDWGAVCRSELAKLKGERPLFVGEFGPYIDGKFFTHENVVPKLREFLDDIQGEEGIAGALLWSMYFHHQDGGFYWHQIFTYPAVWAYHWPGFPSAEAQREQAILWSLREAAFRIQGLTPTAPDRPDAPHLLPIGPAPRISWRGSAGASGYDIQRAAQADGPWATVAANVSDADAAYRALWSDTTARCGESWFYRVLARNGAGVSPPSNIVGPVAVKQVSLIDELKDFSLVAARSDGLSLSNDYNGMYAEYLFRAQGDAGDWLSYRVPGPIGAMKAVAWYAGPVALLKFQTSADGKTYVDLAARTVETPFPSPPGGAAKGRRRTMVTYESAPPPGACWLKIIWTGPAELDLVELDHCNGP